MAQERGANILAEIVGFGMSSDAHHITQPNPAGPAAAMMRALDDAHATPAEVGYINAHGTGTEANDCVEAEAIHWVFKERARTLPDQFDEGITWARHWRVGGDGAAGDVARVQRGSAAGECGARDHWVGSRSGLQSRPCAGDERTFDGVAGAVEFVCVWRIECGACCPTVRIASLILIAHFFSSGAFQ